MANQVYANMMEVSCKAAMGKAICAFPDVCFTPPENPATPTGVPIPYPNTGMASDTTSGSTSVQISGQEVMLKNKSYFKQSYGDEAGCAAKKGVVTSVNRGKVFFNMWSMDVLVEGENAVRMLDLTTHNHGSVPGNTPTWPYIDESYVGVDVWVKCQKDIGQEHEACKDCAPRNPDGINPCDYADNSLVDSPQYLPGGSVDPADVKKPRKQAETLDYAKKINADDCLKARRCMLQPYDQDKGDGCCSGQTGHHLVEGSGFVEGRNSKTEPLRVLQGTTYDIGQAPCVCVEGTNQTNGTHGLLHTHQSTAAANAPGAAGSLTFTAPGETPKTVNLPKKTTYGQAKKQALDAMEKVFPHCDRACIEAQLDAYHNQEGINDDTECKPIVTGRYGDEAVKDAEATQAALEAE